MPPIHALLVDLHRSTLLMVESSSGSNTITLTEGSSLVIGIVQTGITYTITLPDNTTNDGTLDLGNVTMDQAGTYSYLSENGCTASLVLNVQVAEPNPDPDPVLKDIVLYPNPVTDGRVRVVLTDYPNEMMFISFFDIYGKLTIRQMIPTSHGDEVEIDVSSLSGGVYIVEIARSNNDENTYKKVIKLR